jgi:hypothetical protein
MVIRQALLARMMLEQPRTNVKEAKRLVRASLDDGVGGSRSGGHGFF